MYIKLIYNIETEQMDVIIWQTYEHVYDQIYHMIKNKDIEKLCDCVKLQKVNPNKSAVMTYIRNNEKNITQYYKIGVFYLIGWKHESLSVNAWSHIYMMNNLDEI